MLGPDKLALSSGRGGASSPGSLPRLPEEPGSAPSLEPGSAPSLEQGSVLWFCLSSGSVSPGLMTLDFQPKGSSSFLWLLSFGLSLPLSPGGLL